MGPGANRKGLPVSARTGRDLLSLTSSVERPFVGNESMQRYYGFRSTADSHFADLAAGLRSLALNFQAAEIRENPEPTKRVCWRRAD